MVLCLPGQLMHRPRRRAQPPRGWTRSRPGRLAVRCLLAAVSPVSPQAVGSYGWCFVCPDSSCAGRVVRVVEPRRLFVVGGPVVVPAAWRCAACSPLCHPCAAVGSYGGSFCLPGQLLRRPRQSRRRGRRQLYPFPRPYTATTTSSSSPSTSPSPSPSFYPSPCRSPSSQPATSPATAAACGAAATYLQLMAR
jgi:hypothetical protein